MDRNEAELPADGIAIIGMSGRFPGAPDIESLWAMLCEGREAIRHWSDEDLAGVYPNYDEVRKNPQFVKAFGVLDDIEHFDARFFGMSPREATLLDPQHRLFLECTWEALERAGYPPAEYEGSIGIFAGSNTSTYLLHSLMAARSNIEQYVLGLSDETFKLVISTAQDYIATKTAFKLNLRGPAITVQTACSTALVAVIQACQSLLRYETDICLAGAASIAVPQTRGYLFLEGAIGSGDGHCRPFDAGANGTVFANGVGVVALKRLEDAVADGDHIHAVIRGGALNNDGDGKLAFSAPSADGQARAIAMAHAVADVPPDTISYVEAHGTATPLGDPIEITGLTKAFRAGTDRRQFCGIGSIKSNIGHMDTAAGVAGLIKAALALEHEVIPPTVHYTAPNPQIDFEQTPFHVISELTPWRRGSEPRRAGVSSFGIGGTNAHVVLEEAPAVAPSGPARLAQLLVLSARTKEALDTAAARLGSFLSAHPDINLADAAFTLAVGRAPFRHRRVVVARTTADAATMLSQPSSSYEAKAGGNVVFMFPGQGAQYVNMGRELYETEPVYRQHIDAGAAILRPILDIDIRNVLYPAEGDEAEATRHLTQTVITQPALFVVEYALAKLWEEWGVVPDAMIGHSVGEYVAACVAGVFSFDDALRVIAERARLMQAQPAGGMLAVRLSEADVSKRLSGGLALAASNAPQLCVVSGPHDELSQFEELLVADGVRTTRLHTSHAYHSSMMESLLEPFTNVVAGVQRNAPQRRWISSLTGTWVTPEQATDPAYWAQQLRRTVRFSEGISELLGAGSRIMIEVGPGNTLSTFTLQHASAGSGTAVLNSLGHPLEQKSALDSMLLAAGRFWAAGGAFDWNRFYAGQKRRRVILPTYPFERKRYWIDAPPPGESRPAAIGSRTSSAPSVAAGVTVTSASAPDASGSGQASILERLNEVVIAVSGIPANDLKPDETFLEMGLDSLALAQLSARLEFEFGVAIQFRQMIDEISSPRLVARHIETVTNGAAATKPIPAGGIAESTTQKSAAQPFGAPPTPDAKLGRDPQGNFAWYRPDPNRPGKYVRAD